MDNSENYFQNLALLIKRPPKCTMGKHAVFMPSAIIKNAPICTVGKYILPMTHYYTKMWGTIARYINLGTHIQINTKC